MNRKHPLAKRVESVAEGYGKRGWHPVDELVRIVIEARKGPSLSDLTRRPNNRLALAAVRELMKYLEPALSSVNLGLGDPEDTKPLESARAQLLAMLGDAPIEPESEPTQPTEIH